MLKDIISQQPKKGCSDAEFEKWLKICEEDRKQTYRNLNLSQKTLAALETFIIQRHSNDLYRIMSDIINSPREKENLIKSNDGDKQRAAYLVWAHNCDNKKLKIDFLCSGYGISSRYYRELKTINEHQWKIEHIDYIESMILHDIVQSVDPDDILIDEIPDKKEMQYREKILEIIKNGGTHTSQISNFPSSNQNFSIQNEREMMI